MTVVAPSPATSPTPPSMETDVAFDVVHESVVEAPCVIVVGFAPNESTVTPDGAFTVIVTVAVFGPPLPCAVSL